MCRMRKMALEQQSQSVSLYNKCMGGVDHDQLPLRLPHLPEVQEVLSASVLVVLHWIQQSDSVLLIFLWGVQRKFIAVTSAILINIKDTRLYGIVKTEIGFCATVAERMTASFFITHTSLVPRLVGGRRESLVSTVCACTSLKSETTCSYVGVYHYDV